MECNTLRVLSPYYYYAPLVDVCNSDRGKEVTSGPSVDGVGRGGVLDGVGWLAVLDIRRLGRWSCGSR